MQNCATAVLVPDTAATGDRALAIAPPSATDVESLATGVISAVNKQLALRYNYLPERDDCNKHLDLWRYKSEYSNIRKTLV